MASGSWQEHSYMESIKEGKKSLNVNARDSIFILSHAGCIHELKPGLCVWSQETTFLKHLCNFSSRDTS